MCHVKCRWGLLLRSQDAGLLPAKDLLTALLVGTAATVDVGGAQPADADFGSGTPHGKDRSG